MYYKLIFEIESMLTYQFVYLFLRKVEDIYRVKACTDLSLSFFVVIKEDIGGA